MPNHVGIGYASLHQGLGTNLRSRGLLFVGQTSSSAILELKAADEDVCPTTLTSLVQLEQFNSVLTQKLALDFLFQLQLIELA